MITLKEMRKHVTSHRPHTPHILAMSCGLGPEDWRGHDPNNPMFKVYQRLDQYADEWRAERDRKWREEISRDHRTYEEKCASHIPW